MSAHMATNRSTDQGTRRVTDEATRKKNIRLVLMLGLFSLTCFVGFFLKMIFFR